MNYPAHAAIGAATAAPLALATHEAALLAIGAGAGVLADCDLSYSAASKWIIKPALFLGWLAATLLLWSPLLAWSAHPAPLALVQLAWPEPLVRLMALATLGWLVIL